MAVGTGQGNASAHVIEVAANLRAQADDRRSGSGSVVGFRGRRDLYGPGESLPGSLFASKRRVGRAAWRNGRGMPDQLPVAAAKLPENRDLDPYGITDHGPASAGRAAMRNAKARD